MKHHGGLFTILVSLSCAASLPTLADPGFRLVPVTDSNATNISVYDLNRRGELVGTRTIGRETRAFRWRAGQFTDLHDTIDPASTYTQAVGINDRSDIVGVHLVGETFKGILLRGTEVTPVNAVPGELDVFPLGINNRGQMIVDSADGRQSHSYLIDGDNVQQLQGLPSEAAPLNAIAINQRGVVLGNTRIAVGGSRAVLWRDGVVTNLGTVPGAADSFAYDVNDRNQVVGIVSLGGRSKAMRWQNGTMTLLPQLTPADVASSPASINDWGVIVGETIVLEPAFLQTATLWWGNRVVALDALVRADDPSKPFVHLLSAQLINDRGDIVVSGVDSRAPGMRTTYFMTLFDN